MTGTGSYSELSVTPRTWSSGRHLPGLSGTGGVSTTATQIP